MPIVINTGGALGLPMARFKRGATLVDPGVWAKARKHPAVMAHLASGRLVLSKEGAGTPKIAPPPPAQPEPKQPEQTELIPEKDKPADLGALNAKMAIELISELGPEQVAIELERETRKTVIAALEDRKLELMSGED